MPKRSTRGPKNTNASRTEATLSQQPQQQKQSKSPSQNGSTKKTHFEQASEDSQAKQTVTSKSKHQATPSRKPTKQSLARTSLCFTDQRDGIEIDPSADDFKADHTQSNTGRTQRAGKTDSSGTLDKSYDAFTNNIAGVQLQASVKTNETQHLTIAGIVDSASGGGKAGADRNQSSLSGGEESGLLVSSQMLGKYGKTTHDKRNTKVIKREKASI